MLSAPFNEWEFTTEARGTQRNDWNFSCLSGFGASPIQSPAFGPCSSMRPRAITRPTAPTSAKRFLRQLCLAARKVTPV